MKFSIIVPVYNVEKYIDKCLISILEQTYDNFEVIIVNDGSPDNSQAIIDKYVDKDKRFKCFSKKNGGLSDARNFGVKRARGDYILFIDSDDYIEKELLLKIYNIVNAEKVDVVRFSLNVVDEFGNRLRDVEGVVDNLDDKEKIIESILANDYVEPAWLYAYNTKFFKSHKFLYPVGKIHEDFGLTLIILSKALSIRVIDFNGYNYVQRENSIMSDKNYEKVFKRVMDFFEHHIHNREILCDSYINKLLLSYSASCAISKGRELKNDDLGGYLKLLKSNKVVNDIYSNSFKRVLKKIYLKLFLKKYVISLRGK